ncbi:hypothetical protein Tco_0520544 [Tanacetum coccineum]
MIMIIFREVKLFSPSRQPATCAVSGISFFFNFSMAFTVARNVALDEIPGVLPSSMWIFCCPAQASAPSFTSVSVLWCDVCPSRECTLLFLSPNRAKTFLSLGPSLVNIVAFTGLLRRVSFFCRMIQTLRIGFASFDVSFHLWLREDSALTVEIISSLSNGGFVLSEYDQRFPAKKSSTVSLTSRVVVCRGVVRNRVRRVFLEKLRLFATVCVVCSLRSCGAAELVLLAERLFVAWFRLAALLIVGLGLTIYCMVRARGPSDCWAWADYLLHGSGSRPG